jgi:hypothetical protein
MSSRARLPLWIIVAALPIFGTGCTTTLLVRSAFERRPVTDHFRHVEQAYLTSSNELVVCMHEVFRGTNQRFAFSLQCPIEESGTATNDVMVPRRFLKSRWPTDEDVTTNSWTPLPIAVKVIDYNDVFPSVGDLYQTNSVKIVPGTIYKVRFVDHAVFAFGYAPATNAPGAASFTIYHLAVKETSYGYILVFLPVTVAFDVVSLPVGLWVLSQMPDEGSSDYVERHQKHHPAKFQGP